MFPKIFKKKMQEMGSFFKNLKTKTSISDQEKKAVEESYQASKSEKEQIEEDEREYYERGFDPDSKRYQETPQEKVLRESGGQDISAI